MKRTLLSLLLATPLFAHADAPEKPLPYTGEPGALPVQVVLQYLGTELGKDGHFEYGRLRISQSSAPEAFDSAKISVTREGLMDDSVKGIRYQFALQQKDRQWQITRLQKEFLCRRGSKGWGSALCS